MRALIEDAYTITAHEIAKALPNNMQSGKVEIEILGLGIQEVEMVSTPGQFGGLLRWFLCPACERRVGKLYVPAGRGAFLCRHCHKLGYREQLLREFRKTPYERKVVRMSDQRRVEQLNMFKRLVEMLGARNRKKG
jgi:hypothetical protein